EIVIMFLPGEMLFSAALQSDPTLIDLGVEEKVVPATPTTLIALLRTVAYGWTQAALADNAQQVADLARELYERIGNLAEHWSDVGQKLGKAVDSYNKSVGTLERRVLATARKFEPLKAAPEGAELVSPDLVEQVPKLLQAPELVGPADAAANEPMTDAAAANEAVDADVDARVARIG
ncbi:MAG TPA: DNA recombination protein RmuC, partial [Gammaproteobacteria bacterium]|nr:DNA recombination protein RmuC [Gammaproteobacteria bacterium]